MIKQRAHRLFASRLGLILGLLALIVSQAPQAASACSAQTPCQIEGGSYLARTPEGWDGKSPLPVVMFLHGFDSSAQNVMDDQEMARDLSQAHALLIAPQGTEGRPGKLGWSWPGRNVSRRDDVAFLDRVMVDVSQRFPVDAAHTLASGFSLGGSMIWYLACQGHTKFTGYAPIAGAFWVPEPETCPSGPQNIRHIHGVSDETVPMIGRIVGSPTQPSRQGIVMHGISTWQRLNGCEINPPVVDVHGDQICRVWKAKGCSTQHEIVLCLHDEGHFYKGDWVRDAFQWMMGLKTT